MRDSTKHGPRLDDALASETRPLEQGAPLESRAREDLEKEEPPAEPAEPVAARRELSRHLRRSVFPADRQTLVTEAENQNAPAAVLDALRRLPAEERFAPVHEVWAALQGFTDVREAAAREPLTSGER
jgi:hypothetical protein